MSAKKISNTQFDCLFLHYYPKVTAFINGIIHDRNEAESLAQDVFLKILEGRMAIENMGNVDNYLFIASRNSALAWLRKREKCVLLRACATVPTAERRPKTSCWSASL